MKTPIGNLVIDRATLAAISGNALRAMERENWLIEAHDLSESTGADVEEIIKGFFEPFMMRALNASTFPAGMEAHARASIFHHFTKLAL